MAVEMSPEAVTNRMKALDQLWELAVALKSSEIIDRTESLDGPLDELPGFESKNGDD